jgi:hypothetical protein
MMINWGKSKKLRGKSASVPRRRGRLQETNQDRVRGEKPGRN